MAKRPGTIAATRRSSSTIRSNRVINSWTNLLRKSFRALATWTIRRCSLPISRRRLRLPRTHRAILRCRTRSSRRIPRYQRGFSFCSPVLNVASRMRPRSMPIDSPVFGQRLGFLDLAGERDEPLTSPAEDAGRLDRSLDLAMPAHGNPADAGELEATAVDLEAVAVFLEAEPRESVPALEPGIARILTGLDPAEERLERLVQIGHDVLKDVAVDVQGVGAGGLLDLDLAKLHGLGDRHAALFVSLLPLAAASRCRSGGTSRARLRAACAGSCWDTGDRRMP